MGGIKVLFVIEDFLGRFHPVEYRHLDVHEDQVECTVFTLLEGFETVARQGNVQTEFGQGALDELLVDDVVFGNQDFGIEFRSLLVEFPAARFLRFGLFELFNVMRFEGGLEFGVVQRFVEDLEELHAHGIDLLHVVRLGNQYQLRRSFFEDLEVLVFAEVVVDEEEVVVDLALHLLHLCDGVENFVGDAVEVEVLFKVGLLDLLLGLAGENQGVDVGKGAFVGLVEGLDLLEFEGEEEGRTFARFAGEVELTAHQLDEAAGDGQAEAGTAVFAGNGGIRLAEGFEDAGFLLAGNADTAVFDFEADNGTVALFGRHPADIDVDGPAAVGELDGVGKEVDNDLFDLGRVAFKRPLQTRVDKTAKVDVFLGGTDGVDLHGAFELFHRIEDDLFDLQLVALDFREVEDVVDDLQEVFGAFLDDVDEFTLLFVEVGVF